MDRFLVKMYMPAWAGGFTYTKVPGNSCFIHHCVYICACSYACLYTHMDSRLRRLGNSLTIKKQMLHWSLCPYLMRHSEMCAHCHTDCCSSHSLQQQCFTTKPSVGHGHKREKSPHQSTQQQRMGHVQGITLTSVRLGQCGHGLRVGRHVDRRWVEAHCRWWST